MTRPARPPARFLTHPVEFITDLVQRVDPGLDAAVITEVIGAITTKRAQQQRLARALHDDPDLLTSARPAGPPTVGRLISELQRRGARHLAQPRCADCGRSKPLRQRNHQGERICGACFDRKRERRATCSTCGHHRGVHYRDRAGRPFCRRCPPEPHIDPTALLCQQLGRHDPDFDPHTLRQLVEQVVPHPFRRRELAWAIEQHPGLLTGAGAEGTPKLLALLDTLIAAGVGNLVAPACPFCGRTIRLRHVRDGLRCCTRCYEASRAQPCSRCGKIRQICHRDPAGEPLCGGCGAPRETCVRCGRPRRVSSRIDDGPICGTCIQREPEFHHACTNCGTVERLHHHGLCARCAYPLVLRDLLSVPDRGMRPELEPVFTALAASDPRSALQGIQRRSLARALASLAAGDGPVTHETLDQLGLSHRAVHTLRTILVNVGVLPWRDDILASLEQRITDTIAKIPDPHERKIVRTFATWHHIRRLRAQSSPSQPLDFTQSRYVRRTIKTIVDLLRWLRDRDRCLATCTQADIDDWLAIDTRHMTRGFLAWAVARSHAHNVHITAFETTKTYQVLPEHDQRWTLAKQLLHDENLHTSDRVAGLLVLLYAQHLSHISRLTTEHITQHNDEVHLLIGAKPLVLPDPLDSLVLRLANNRRGHAALGHHDDHPWLFPGGTPGQPLSPARLTHRLKPLGFQARAGRNTALIDLAAELPATVLSQLLGISIGRATIWAHHAGNTRPTYAATLARRNELRKI